MVSDFSVAATRLWAVVLAESRLLGRVVVRVIANDVGNQHGVGQTVWDVELGAQFVGH